MKPENNIENTSGAIAQERLARRCAAYNKLNATEYTPETYDEERKRVPRMIAWDEGWEACRSYVAAQFARYRDARERQYSIASRRGGRFGIAIFKDELALAWQAESRAVEESSAFLEGRRPIPECWGESSPANAQGDARPAEA